MCLPMSVGAHVAGFCDSNCTTTMGPKTVDGHGNTVCAAAGNTQRSLVFARHGASTARKKHVDVEGIALGGAVQRDDAHGGHGVDEYIVRVGGHLGEGRGFGRDAGDDDTRASKCRISRVTIR